MQWRHLVAVAHVVSVREQRVQSLRSAWLPPPLAPGVKPAAGAIIIIIIIVIIRETERLTLPGPKRLHIFKCTYIQNSMHTTLTNAHTHKD